VIGLPLYGLLPGALERYILYATDGKFLHQYLFHRLFQVMYMKTVSRQTDTVIFVVLSAK